MSKYDELLARLESIAGPGWDLPEQAAAAIRELLARDASPANLEPVAELISYHAAKIRWLNDTPYQSAGFKFYALAPERTVAGQNPDNVSVGGDVRAPSNGSLGASCTSSAPAAAPVAHSKSQYKRLVTQGAIAPVSPLLPGLERAAEICDPIQRRCEIAYKEGVPLERNHPQVFGEAEGARVCKEAIRAEISRLKGEGSDHE